MSEGSVKTVKELQEELNAIGADIARVRGEMILLAERQRRVKRDIVEHLGRVKTGG